jgi:hypothetical protein
MAKKPSIIGSMTAEEIRWIDSKTKAWKGIDDLPYTELFENAHANFCAAFGKSATLNFFWKAFVRVRKLPAPQKAKYGLKGAKDRKKRQRYVGPMPGDSTA